MHEILISLFYWHAPLDPSFIFTYPTQLPLFLLFFLFSFFFILLIFAFILKKVKAFPIHFGFILYFTSLKNHFSILTTYFYKIFHISFSILPYIILKYYKIILFYIFFSHSNQTHSNHHRSHHSRQPPKTHSRLLNHGNHL